MITFIFGEKGKSLVAKGIESQLAQQGKNPFVFHSEATRHQIDTAKKEHSDVIVCFQKDREFVEDADCCIHIATKATR